MIYIVRHADGTVYVTTASEVVAEECCRYLQGEYIEVFDEDMRHG